jgi:peptidoglycan/LPS O-acetylase OafA/YrhL
MHSLDYRPEIDGLRAVAVIPVILFHMDFDWMPGGFVGVDVFFIISGFLITSLILKEYKASSFTLRNFWARRIRRILPALLTLEAGIWIIPLLYWKNLNQSAKRLWGLGLIHLLALAFRSNMMATRVYNALNVIVTVCALRAFSPKLSSSNPS